MSDEYQGCFAILTLFFETDLSFYRFLEGFKIYL